MFDLSLDFFKKASSFQYRYFPGKYRCQYLNSTDPNTHESRMGKRKLHTLSYVQCDWSGYPMAKAGCFMPSWDSLHATKMSKHGHYANWESVVAAAHEDCYVHKLINEDEFTRIKKYIQSITHTENVQPAPHYKNLLHFGGDITQAEFHEIITADTGECECVILPFGENKEPFAGYVDSNHNKIDFSTMLTRPMHGYQELLTIVPAKKTKTPNLDLCVMYYGGDNGLVLNTAASAHFKFNIYGDALLVKRSKEFSFLPRERYVDYQPEAYKLDFERKRRREEPAALSPTAYSGLKAQAKSEAVAFEKHASSGAGVPLKGKKMKPMGGKALAKLARDRQATPLPPSPSTPPNSPEVQPTIDAVDAVVL